MTESEMQKMQQEAIRRTQELQRRASSFNTSSEVRQQTHKEKPPEITVGAEFGEETARTEAINEKKPPEHKDEHESMSGGIFETLFRDKEKTLILGILLLLMDEKTDNALIMALMYLLI